jgi:hypothetical protein
MYQLSIAAAFILRGGFNKEGRKPDASVTPAGRPFSLLPGAG